MNTNKKILLSGLCVVLLSGSCVMQAGLARRVWGGVEICVSLFVGLVALGAHGATKKGLKEQGNIAAAASLASLYAAYQIGKGGVKDLLDCKDSKCCEHCKKGLKQTIQEHE